MNDFFEMVIPAGVIIGIFFMIFSFAAFMRYLRYKETIALAEKGLLHPKHAGGTNGRDTLRWGIIITAVGMALTLGICSIALFTETPEILIVVTLIGLVPMFFGIGLIIIHRIAHQNQGED